MNFTMEEAIEILERTPQTLEALLTGLSLEWIHSNEGDGTWNATEVIGHLIEGEKNDWITRIKIILNDGEKTTFPKFDMHAHLQESSQKPIEQKLNEFKELRTQKISALRELVDPEVHLKLSGVHPALGVVKLSELLATWVVHDLTHIAQIVRVMAERYRDDVGPWIQYLGILKQKK